MKRYACGTLGLIAVLLVASTQSAWAQDKATGTKTASCLVRISSDEAIFPINPDVIEQLLLSTPVLGPPAREILGSKALNYEDDVNVSFEALNDSHTREGIVLIGKVEVDIHGGGALKAKASEFLEAICGRLEGALRAAGQQDKDRLFQRLERVEEELERSNQQYEQVRSLQRELVEQAGYGELSRELIENRIRGLVERMHDARLHFAGLQAREEALAVQIAKIGEQATQQSEQDPIVDQLTRVVAIREQALQRVKDQFKSGVVSTEEVAEVETQLLHARMELMQYRQNMVEKAGAGLLENLNRELIQNGIELAASEVEYGLIEQRLAEIREKRLLELADRYHREVELPLRMSEKIVYELIEQQFELRQDLRDTRMPEVQVLGGN